MGRGWGCRLGRVGAGPGLRTGWVGAGPGLPTGLVGAGSDMAKGRNNFFQGFRPFWEGFGCKKMMKFRLSFWGFLMSKNMSNFDFQICPTSAKHLDFFYVFGNPKDDDFLR